MVEFRILQTVSELREYIYLKYVINSGVYIKLDSECFIKRKSTYIKSILNIFQCSDILMPLTQIFLLEHIGFIGCTVASMQLLHTNNLHMRYDNENLKMRDFRCTFARHEPSSLKLLLCC